MIHGLAWNLVPSAVPNFTLIRESLGFWPKNPKNCQNCQLFRPAGANPLLDVGEIRRVYAGNRSTEVVNVWCDSVGKLGIYRQKLRWGISPKNFRSSSETTGPIEKKIKAGCKNGTDILYIFSRKVWWRSAAARRREKENLRVFVCLSRSGLWTWIKNWRTRGLVIQIAILSPFVG